MVIWKMDHSVIKLVLTIQIPDKSAVVTQGKSAVVGHTKGSGIGDNLDFFRHMFASFSVTGIYCML